MTPSTLQTDRIATLNDRLRSHFIGGQVMITSGVQLLGPQFRRACVQAVRDYGAFDPADDPHGEHDFGSVLVDGRTVWWKIDCYDHRLEEASPDPADPAVTTRVLTIFLPEEY